jgi:hypothetical protein
MSWHNGHDGTREIAVHRRNPPSIVRTVVRGSREP